MVSGILLCNDAIEVTILVSICPLPVSCITNGYITCLINTYHQYSNCAVECCRVNVVRSARYDSFNEIQSHKYSYSTNDRIIIYFHHNLKTSFPSNKQFYLFYFQKQQTTFQKCMGTALRAAMICTVIIYGMYLLTQIFHKYIMNNCNYVHQRYSNQLKVQFLYTFPEITQFIENATSTCLVPQTCVIHIPFYCISGKCYQKNSNSIPRLYEFSLKLVGLF